MFVTKRNGQTGSLNFGQDCGHWSRGSLTYVWVPPSSACVYADSASAISVVYSGKQPKASAAFPACIVGGAEESSSNMAQSLYASLTLLP